MICPKCGLETKRKEVDFPMNGQFFICPNDECQQAFTKTKKYLRSSNG